MEDNTDRNLLERILTIVEAMRPRVENTEARVIHMESELTEFRADTQDEFAIIKARLRKLETKD